MAPLYCLHYVMLFSVTCARILEVEASVLVTSNRGLMSFIAVFIANIWERILNVDNTSIKEKCSMKTLGSFFLLLKPTLKIF